MRTLSLLLVLFVSSSAPAAEKTAADLLPATTVAYAEITDPQALLRGVLSHPLRKKLEALDEYKTLWESRSYKQLRTVTTLVQFQLGMTWQQAVEKLTRGGVYAGIDGDSGGLAVLAKAADADSLEKIKATLLKLARNGKNKQKIPQRDYRGITAYDLGRVKFAAAGQWLIFFNKNKIGKTLLDNYKDDGGSRLSSNARFTAARATAVDKPTMWSYVDVAVLRKGRAGNGALQGKADDAGAEVLLGGILGTLKKSPYATSSFYFTPKQLRLRIATPFQAKWIGEKREYFFGKGAQGKAPTVLPAKNKLLTVAVYRDLSQMWLRASDLFDKATNEELAKADSTLTTLFSGRDFGEDILGAFHPDMQIILTRQDFSQAKVKPAIRLPAGALVLRLKNPKKNTGELRRIFQSLVGFLNIAGAMEGQPQLDLDIEKKNGVQLVSATYVLDENEDKNKARINFNFSPSIAFAGERVILASSKHLARELATARSPADPPDRVVNVESVTYFQAIKDILNDNRGQLIAQTMLSEGKNRKEAAQQIDLLLSAIGMLKDASLRLFTTKKTLAAEIKLRLAD